MSTSLPCSNFTKPETFFLALRHWHFFQELHLLALGTETYSVLKVWSEVPKPEKLNRGEAGDWDKYLVDTHKSSSNFAGTHVTKSEVYPMIFSQGITHISKSWLKQSLEENPLGVNMMKQLYAFWFDVLGESALCFLEMKAFMTVYSGIWTMDEFVNRLVYPYVEHIYSYLLPALQEFHQLGLKQMQLGITPHEFAKVDLSNLSEVYLMLLQHRKYFPEEDEELDSND